VEGPLVRRGTLEDFDAVAALLEELGRPRIGAQRDEHREAWRFYLSRTDAIALVAVDDGGSVVGFCDLELRQRLHFLSPQAWIPDLVVAPGARGLGVGAALLSSARTIAIEHRAWGMTLESAAWRIDAHRFYEREGWRPSGLSFTTPLSDQPWPPPRPAR
jgi:PhnO protein